jgi:hypothetical protein
MDRPEMNDNKRYSEMEVSTTTHIERHKAQEGNIFSQDPTVFRRDEAGRRRRSGFSAHHRDEQQKRITYFFDKGCFINLGSNYIQLLHNQDAHSRSSVWIQSI